MKEKTISVLALIISILVAFAVIWSSVSTSRIWQHSIEISKADVALQSPEIKRRRLPSNDIVQFYFSFPFKNLGKEGALILDVQLGLIPFKTMEFRLTSKKPVINKMHSGTTYNYQHSYKINVNPKLSKEELEKVLPDIVGMNAIVLLIRYKREYTGEEVENKYFFAYMGTHELFLLQEAQYEQIKDVLPSEFKLE